MVKFYRISLPIPTESYSFGSGRTTKCAPRLPHNSFCVKISTGFVTVVYVMTPIISAQIKHPAAALISLQVPIKKYDFYCVENPQ